MMAILRSNCKRLLASPVALSALVALCLAIVFGTTVHEDECASSPIAAAVTESSGEALPSEKKAPFGTQLQRPRGSARMLLQTSATSEQQKQPDLEEDSGRFETVMHYRAPPSEPSESIAAEVVEEQAPVKLNTQTVSPSLEASLLPGGPPPEVQNVIVPVPLYKHKRYQCARDFNNTNPLGADFLDERCGPAAIAEAKGEAVLPEGSEAIEEHAEHSQAHTVLLLLFLILMFGVLTQHLLSRYFPFVPFTAALFVEGFLISVIQALKRDNNLVMFSSYDTAVGIWEKADPHLMLYIFLPPLIFGDSMSMNISLVKRCFSQCMLLAGPGVLLGAFLTGLCSMYMFPYGWDIYTAMLFGSILAATDPVAVVAIFNSLGVSPRLTMVISGESLFNDGTAYVLFVLFMDMCSGVRPSFTDVISFFLKMTTNGPIFGACFGLAIVWFLGLTCDEHYHGDAMGQVMVTICCAYLSHFIAEQMETSGMLTLVTIGMVVASNAWPRFVERETLRTIWHALEFIGNTVIFTLAGIIFGGIVMYRWEIITYRDYFFLAILYVMATLIRAFVIAVLWVPLNMCGHPLSPQEGVVMVWGGMRGAVGLLMAVAADRVHYIDAETGTRIMFHVGGIASMMLLINGPLTPSVLRLVGLMDKEDQAGLNTIAARVSARTHAQLLEEIQSPSSRMLFAGAEEDEVMKMLPHLSHGHGEEQSSPTPPTGAGTPRPGQERVNKNQLRMLRESLLRVVKASYWELVDAGVLPRKTGATSTLLDSADLAMMDSLSVQGIRDWEVVRTRLALGEYGSEDEYRNNAPMLMKFPFIGIDYDHYIQRGIIAALCFMHAHEHALHEVKAFMSADKETEEEKKLFEEVEFNKSQAAAFVASQPEQMVKLVRTKMLATKLLQYQANQIVELAERGLITDKNASAMEHAMHKSSQDLLMMRMDQAVNLFTNPLGSAAALVANPLGFMRQVGRQSGSGSPAASGGART